MTPTYELITPQKPIHGEVILPGSKSFTNRALILAAQAQGISTLRGASKSDDAEAMVQALCCLGVEIQRKEDVWTVHAPHGLTPYSGNIDVGPAGTSMRFLTALLASIPGSEVTLSGSARMHERPIGDLVEALRSMGAHIEYLEKQNCPPLHIRGKNLSCKEQVKISGAISSQFLSALLLSSPRIENFHIAVQGELTSRSYVNMTLGSLAQFHVHVQEVQEGEFLRRSCDMLAAQDLVIEGDASGASYLFGLAALSGGEVTVQNISLNSSQGDAEFPLLLERMGCSLCSGGEGAGAWVRVKGPEKLSGITADMTLMPDTAQTLVVLCANAEGKSCITGLHTLKSKETDRIEALASELAKFGCVLKRSSSHIEVIGKGRLSAPQAPVRISTYEDHRMAMSFAQLGAILPNIWIENPDVVSKSFPEFWEVMQKLGVSLCKEPLSKEG